MAKLLERLQQDFADALLYARTERRLFAALAGDEAHNRNRLALYRGNLTGTWHAVLASAYPVLRSLVGDAFFSALSREYGLAEPSGSGDLNRFGHRMAELLAAWPPSAPYGYLADVARLEWLVHRAYYAADASPWPAERWAQYAPETVEASTVRLHPSVELLRTSTRAADLWLAGQSAGQDCEPHDIEAPQWMVVVRPHWMVQVVAIRPSAFVMLDALRQGATLGAALDTALARDADFDFVGNWRTWIELGIVVAATFVT